MNDYQIEKLPFSKKLVYAAGQFGWAIASFGVMNLLYYFYDANVVDGTPMFPRFLPTIAIIGIIAGVGRLIDAVTDPIIAGWSDRCEHPLGRRRFYMAIGGIPFILFSILVFVPPVDGISRINEVWLAVMTILFYIAMTIYITPYFALIAEMGHTSDERMELSTYVAIAWALGFMVANSIYVLQGLFENMGYTSVRGIQLSVGIFGLIGVILIYLPVFFLNEKRYCYPRVSKQGIWESISTAFQNKNFRIFAFADLFYFIALTFLQTGISYYVIQLLGENKEKATTFMLLLFVASFILYAPVYFLAKRWGKKPVLILSFILFAVGSFFNASWGLIPLSSTAVTLISIVILVIPVSAFGFLLYATVGDIAEVDGYLTGNFKEGFFFGTRTFMSKMGNTITLVSFYTIAHIGGGDQVTQLGLRISLCLAGGFMLLGLLLYLRYDEKGILAVLQKYQQK